MLHKAGCVCFYRGKDNIEFLFMVPSDPFYGGYSPQIAKGNVDDETYEETAIREAKEELGLKKSNIKKIFHLFDVYVVGKYSEYMLHLYGVEVKNQENFSVPHYETKHTVWLDESKLNTIRKNHRKILERTLNFLNET